MSKEFGPGDFTATSWENIPFDPIPKLKGEFDPSNEVENFNAWRSRRGFELHLENAKSSYSRIQLWTDDNGIARLAVVEFKNSEWPVYRQPIIEEMVRFVKVAQYVMPNDERTLLLEDEIDKRLAIHAEQVRDYYTDLLALKSTIKQDHN